VPKLTMLSAPSASGKSTLAKKLLQEDGNAVRLNRDDLRIMSILKWTGRREKWIVAAEMGLCAVAAKQGLNIIVDDTNLMPSDEDRWKNVARQLKYEFVKMKLDVPIEECVLRDSRRAGNARIGRPTIERQFLKGQLWHPRPDMKVWIFDIDGTLADLTHRVPWITVGADCPDCLAWKKQIPNGGRSGCEKCVGMKIAKKNHDEFYARVPEDTPIDIVCRWIQAVYNEIDETGKRKNMVLIVSGRSPEKSGEETVTWLEQNNIKYDHIIMRRSNMHGPDDEEKQLILDLLLKVMPKEQIAYVVDDRPSVIDMWRRNGLHVIPVRGRDDDDFYKTMNELEAHHGAEPVASMEPCSGTDCDCHKLPQEAVDMITDAKEQLNEALEDLRTTAVHGLFTKAHETYSKTVTIYRRKPAFKRTWGSYINQGVVRLQRWWSR